MTYFRWWGWEFNKFRIKCLLKYTARNTRWLPPSLWRLLHKYSELRLNIKTVFSGYGDSHVKDKTVARPSYLLHGDPTAGKTTSLYINGPQMVYIFSQYSDGCIGFDWTCLRTTHVLQDILTVLHKQCASELLSFSKQITQARSYCPGLGANWS